MTSPVYLPFCGAAPLPDDVLARWTLDPLLLLVLAVFPAAFSALRSRTADGSATRRTLWFWLGWASLVVAFVSPLCALSAALFSARVTHHVILVAVAGPFLALALPLTRIAVGGRAGLLLFVHAATLWFWHAPAPYEAALRSDALYWLMQGSLLGTAYLFWAAILSRGARPATTAAYGLVAMMQMGLLGALITFTPAPMYAAHFLTTEPFGLSALADQQLAGLIMWVPGSLPYILAILLAGARLVRVPVASGAR